jgi:hypothetical protein
MSKLVRRLLAGLTLLVAGCGTAPQFGEVEGVITYQGRPMGNLRIQFFLTDPPPSGKAMSSLGVSDAQGRYVLTCDNGQPGAMVGRHKVTVIDKDLEEGPEVSKGPPRQSRIPRKYMTATSSPLEIEVKPGKQTIELPLTP